MKIFLTSLLFTFLFINLSRSQPKDPIDVFFQMNVNIDSSNSPKVLLSWEKNLKSQEYIIDGRIIDNPVFYRYYQNYNQSMDNFEIPIEKGKIYEFTYENYLKTHSQFGSICAGYDIPLIENRGVLQLLVDSTIYEPLKFEIDRLVKDLIGDGYKLILTLVPRAEKFDFEKVQIVKNLVDKEYQKYKSNFKGIFLLGRVPVPYSGFTTFDGHRPGHVGAWGCDGYYAEYGTDWVDTSSYDNAADSTRQYNFRADGKFDNNFFQTDVDFMFGRVDMYNLPAYSQSELELIKRYLDKNHKYKRKLKKYEYKAVIDDQFKMYSIEALASSAWINYSALVGRQNIDTARIRKLLTTKEYLLSYGCNSGGITSCMFIAYADDFAKQQLNTVFYNLFGSWFGDWDEKNNLLRSIIASEPSSLVALWDGRPFINMFPMAFGLSVGEVMLRSMNYSTEYFNSSKYGHHGIHMNTIGDPTIRLHVVDPPDSLVCKVSIDPNSKKNKIELSWDKSDDDVVGYNIYMADSLFSDFYRVNQNLIVDNFYTLDTFSFFDKIFQVRAVKKENVVSGNYYNQSIGTFAQLSGFIPEQIDTNRFNVRIIQNKNRSQSYYIYSSQSGVLDLLIYDLNGRLVKSIENKEISQRANFFTIDLINNEGTSIANGIYLLRIIFNDKSFYDKFVITD